MGDKIEVRVDFHAEDWFHIRDRGWVASVRNHQEWKRDECPLIGLGVLIDGIPYHVLGVESFALRTIRAGAPIGLLVDGEPPDDPWKDRKAHIANDAAKRLGASSPDAQRSEDTAP